MDELHLNAFRFALKATANLHINQNKYLLKNILLKTQICRFKQSRLKLTW